MNEADGYEPAEARSLLLAGKARAPFVVNGSLNLGGEEKLKSLPAGLKCFELDLSGTAIEELPDDIQVESSLVLRGCTKLKRLPQGLTVGTLDLQGCESLIELPEGLDVWFLNLRGCTSLSRFPSAAQIRHGSLSVSGCRRLSQLPDYLTNLATLDVSDCPKIDRLPIELVVELWIDVGGSGITTLDPPNHEVGLRWRGVSVSRRIAFHPETITAVEALQEQNTELRRVMIERMGTENFMRQASPVVIDQDSDAGGKRELLRLPLPKDEDMVCLSCYCPSTSRHYLLRVPPTMKSCHQAAAWMAGFDDPSKYQPAIET